MRTKPIAGSRLPVLLTMTAIAFACSKSPSDQPPAAASVERGPTASATAPTQDLTRGTLRLAIAPVIAPEHALRRYESLAQYLGAAVGRPGAVVTRSSYAEVSLLVRRGACDLALVCTYAYVEGQADFGMRAIAAPVVRGQETYQSYIVVPASSPARQLSDLRNARFAFTDLLSASGWLYPTDWLLDHGEDPSTFFRDFTITGSHDHSLLAVARGLADGAAVDSLVFEEMTQSDAGLTAAVRVLQRSERYGMPPMVVGPRTSEALRSRLTTALLGMHDTPEGRRVLETLGIDRFAEPNDAAYEPVRRAARRVEGR